MSTPFPPWEESQEASIVQNAAELAAFLGTARGAGQASEPRRFFLRLAYLATIGVISWDAIDEATDRLASVRRDDRLPEFNRIVERAVCQTGESFDRLMNLVKVPRYLLPPPAKQTVRSSPPPDPAPAPAEEPDEITPDVIVQTCARAHAEALDSENRQRYFGAIYRQNRHRVTREEVELRLAIHHNILESLLGRVCRRAPAAFRTDLVEILEWVKGDRRRVIADLFELDTGENAAKARFPEAYNKESARDKQLLRAVASIIAAGGTTDRAASQLRVSWESIKLKIRLAPKFWHEALAAARRRAGDGPGCPLQALPDVQLPAAPAAGQAIAGPNEAAPAWSAVFEEPAP